MPLNPDGLLAGEPYAAAEEPPRIYCPAGCEDGYECRQRCETCRGLGWTEADGTPAADADLLAWAREIDDPGARRHRDTVESSPMTGGGGSMSTAAVVPERGSRWQFAHLPGHTYTVEGYIAPAALADPAAAPAEVSHAIDIGKAICRDGTPDGPLRLLALTDFPQPQQPGRLIPASDVHGSPVG